MHRKISSLIAAITIVLLTVTLTFSALQMYPKQAYALNLTDSVSMSPMTNTLATLPTAGAIYWVNVTSTGTDYINNVSILIPTGWTYVSGAVGSGYGFGAPSPGGGWVNFTTALGTFDSGAIANFSIPVTISTIPPTTGTWTIYCYQGVTPSASNPVTVTVTVNLEFDAIMTPNYVKNGTSYIYTITTTNDACPIGIDNINITFPAGTWIFNVLVQFSPLTWTVSYNNVNTFVLSGPNLLEGDAVTIMVNMTVPVTAGGAPGGLYPWIVAAWSSTAAFLGNYTMPAIVDNTTPTISISAPNEAYYSDGFDSYIWLNITVHDTPNMAEYFSQYQVSINDSRFQLYSAPFEVNAQTYDYYYVNNTGIIDGPLAVRITAIDPADNIGTAVASTTVDNTMPKLLFIYVVDQNGNSLYPGSNGIFWMGKSTTAIYVEAAFWSQQSTLSGSIYFNSTPVTFLNDTYLPTSPGYSVVGSNLVTVNITLSDFSSPTPNVYTNTWTVLREITPPSVPSYTKTTTICGGFIIYGLTATDTVGIYSYNIMLNGTSESLSPINLNSLFGTWGNDYCYCIQNITVFDLFDNGYSAGDVANITIEAVNFGSNVGPPLTFLVTVQAGQWYPVQMYPKWNLISFPLIPYSTTTSNIYSLLLLNGAAGVSVTYGWNSATSAWTLNPTTMSDGNGYWVDMNAYDVLIVQGYPISAPAGTPPPIVEYSLTTGWNLAGYTETFYGMYAPEYVGSLQSTSVLQSYFRFVYVWDAYDQLWQSVDLFGSYYPYYLYPGQGFWIYMYNAQTLIPPTP
jgi:hypothetical protein